MIYSNELIDKLFSYKTYSNKRKIDTALEMIAIMRANLGIDSTKTEKELVIKNSRYIFRAINKIDSELGKLLLEHQDR